MEVLVLVDFEGQLSDELKISAGDVVRRVQPGPEEGWLQGELDGRTALFPQQFVQEIPPGLRADGTRRYPRSLRSGHGGKPQPNGQRPRWCRVAFAYAPTKEDELALAPGELVQILEEIEDGWWLGRKGGRLGAFPSNFVQELSGPDPGPDFTEPKVGAGKKRPKMTDATFLLSEPQEETEAEKVAPQAAPGRSHAQGPQTPSGNVPCYCRAMFDYEPAHEDELALRKGDLILLLSKETVDVGWWRGESRGQRGLFPDNFVMPLAAVEPGIQSKVPARKVPSATRVEKKGPQGSKGETKPPGDPKESKEQKRTDAPKGPPAPVKKAAPLPPPPPVPAKAKPAAGLPHKSPGTPAPSMATPGAKGKCKETEADTLDAVRVPSTKLSHPTAGRPKVPGKRPPSQPTGSSLEEKEPPSCPSSATEEGKSAEPVPLPPPSFPSREEQPEAKAAEDRATSLEGLQAELRALRTSMDLIRGQHQRETEELKAQLSREQALRAALQADVEWLKQAVPRLDSLDPAGKKTPGGRGAVEPGALGASSPAQDLKELL